MNLEKLVLPFEVDTKALIGLAGITAAVGALTASIAGAISATFKWADELDHLQDVTGVTAKQAAALNFVLRKSGTETDKLTKGMTIFEKGLIKSNGTLDVMGKAMKGFGINVLDVNGKVKDQATLISEIGNKYNSFATQTQRVDFLTNVFGKSGAELVDFFDTLAQEGGIDKVTKKVEAFGLAIDPERYEQFNRSLNELKLIGLGLAVSFTEKVMPILEKFLSIIGDPNLTTSDKIRMVIDQIDKFVGAVIQGLADSIQNWVNGAGPQELSLKLINWINGIGQTSPGQPNSATITAMGNLVQAIASALALVPWGIIGTTLQDKFNEQLSSLYKNNKGLVAVIATLATAIIGTNIVLLLGSVANALLTLSVNANMLMAGEGLAALPGVFGKVVLALGAMDALLSGLPALLIALAPLLVLIGLIAIAVYMLHANWDDFARGVQYTSDQIKVALNSAALVFQTAWINAINTVINGINTIRSILDMNPLSLVNQMMGNNPGRNVQGGNTTTGAGSSNGRRASGGPVIAGQRYNVAEFNKSEVFTPNQSGRIDSNKPQMVQIDETTLGTVFGRVLGEQLQRRYV